MENKPLDLTVEEIEIIRKAQGIRNPNKVNLNYKKGYFMISQMEEDIYEKLSELTVYLLHMCGYRMNKDGLLKYKNGRAIRTFKSLREYYNLSHYKWTVIKNDIDNYKLMCQYDNCLYINPMLQTHSDFELNEIHIKMFGIECFEKYWNSTKDIKLVEKYKCLLHEYEYQEIMCKLNPDKYYTITNEIVSKNGIYILFKDNEIVYIGKSKNIKHRIQEHKKDKLFNNVKIILFKNEPDINLYEPYLINKYKPIYNNDLKTELSNNIKLPDIDLREATK